MFNGIIFNSGKVKTIKKNKKSILIGIESDLLLKKKILVHQFVVMVFV